MDKNLKKIVSQLKGASKMHLGQAKMIENHIKMMKNAGKKKKK